MRVVCLECVILCHYIMMHWWIALFMVCIHIVELSVVILVLQPLYQRNKQAFNFIQLYSFAFETLLSFHEYFAVPHTLYDTWSSCHMPHMILEAHMICPYEILVPLEISCWYSTPVLRVKDFGISLGNNTWSPRQHHGSPSKSSYHRNRLQRLTGTWLP